MELLNLFRISATFWAVFIFIPWLVFRSQERNFACSAAAGFIRASLFFILAGSALSEWKLCLPGMVIGLWLIWLAVSVTWQNRKQIWPAQRPAQKAFLRLLDLLEKGFGAAVRRRANPFGRSVRISPITLMVAPVAAALFLQWSLYPLQNLRFATMTAYQSSLTLNMLAHGLAVIPDAFTLLLIPLNLLSGLDPATVVRYSGPVFGLALALAAAFCAFRLARRVDAALVAFALLLVAPMLAGGSDYRQFSHREAASLYWLMSVAFMQDRKWIALCSAGIALSAGGLPTVHFLMVIGCVAAAVLAAEATQSLPAKLRTAMAVILVSVLTFSGLSLRASIRFDDGPYQYESAARQSARIAQFFPHKEWMIISPGQELVFTYGRGWHTELLDFTSQFNESQVADPKFRFPYSHPDIFIFIETVPLVIPQKNGSRLFGPNGLAQTSDRAVAGYAHPLGRESLQFAAAALIAAYGRNHDDIELFYQDDHLSIYHVTALPARDSNGV